MSQAIPARGPAVTTPCPQRVLLLAEAMRLVNSEATTGARLR